MNKFEIHASQREPIGKATRILILIFLLAISVQPATAESRQWAEYASDNFRLYSDAGAKRAEEVLRKLESFRKLALTVTGLGDAAEKQRLRIMMYARRSDFRQLAADRRVGGFYSFTSRGPTIVVGPSIRLDEAHILFHEYVHHLVQTSTTLRLPRWYSEGFAELLSVAEIRGEEVVIGTRSFREKNLRELGKISVGDLLEEPPFGNSGFFSARYYATAWLLTHYLQISPFSTGSPLREQTAEYLRRYNQGGDLSAFTAAFGMSPEDMDEALLYYGNQSRKPQLTLTIPQEDFEFARRELTASEQAYILADTAWRFGKEESALDYLEAVPDAEPGDARTLSLRAVLENHRDRSAVAEELMQQALELGEADAELLNNVAHVKWDHFERSRKQGAPAAHFLDESLHYSHRATQADPNLLEAYQFQWMAHRHRNESAEALTAMMSAYRLHPAMPGLDYRIGDYLLELGRADLAHDYAQRARQWAHDPKEAERTRVLLQKVERALDNTADP